jgi:hypothetical protein
MQDLNNIPVTKEEEEAMDALSRLGAGVPFGYVGEGKTAVFNAPQVNAPDITPTQPTLETIITNICAQLQLLSSVIKEGQEKGNSQAGEKSLQECLDATLQQAEWFKEAVEEKVETLVDDMDHSYGIESEVESYFSNSFCLDDHVDITAEVESKVEDIAEDLIKDMVEERLAEIVSDKLQNLRITFE